MERFTDGPWVPDAVAADRFDAGAFSRIAPLVLERIRTQQGPIPDSLRLVIRDGRRCRDSG